jgi:hypothetical protein
MAKAKSSSTIAASPSLAEAEIRQQLTQSIKYNSIVVSLQIEELAKLLSKTVLDVIEESDFDIFYESVKHQSSADFAARQILDLMPDGAIGKMLTSRDYRLTRAIGKTKDESFIRDILRRAPKEAITEDVVSSLISGCIEGNKGASLKKIYQYHPKEFRKTVTAGLAFKVFNKPGQFEVMKALFDIAPHFAQSWITRNDFEAILAVTDDAAINHSYGQRAQFVYANCNEKDLDRVLTRIAKDHVKTQSEDHSQGILKIVDLYRDESMEFRKDVNSLRQEREARMKELASLSSSSSSMSTSGDHKDNKSIASSNSPSGGYVGLVQRKTTKPEAQAPSKTEPVKEADKDQALGCWTRLVRKCFGGSKTR